MIGTYQINFDDWMFLIDDKHLINRNYLKNLVLMLVELNAVYGKESS